MSEIVKVLPYSVHLDEPIVKTPLPTLFATEDKAAHRFELTLYTGGAPLDLAGAGVTAYFIRHADRATVPITGSIEGGKAVVVLSDACYALPGKFTLTIKISSGSVREAVFFGEGGVTRSRTDSMVDPDDVIPSIDELLAQITAMETATAAANTAAGNANIKASAAQTAANAANTAAGSANTAAGNANAAAAKIDGMTVSASASATAAATVSEKNGVKHIAFGLPRGETGATPVISFSASTGAPGTDVELEQSGTAAAPVVHLTIPRGDTGAVDGIDYYAGTPKALGTASPGTANGVARGDHVHPMPTADQVGALAKTAQAADSAKLGGKDPAYYIQPFNYCGNSDFLHPVNQSGKTTYTTASGTTIDRWVMSKGQVSVGAGGVILTASDGSCVLTQYVDGLADGDYCFAVHAAGQIGYRNFTLSGGTITSISSSGYTGGYLQVIYVSSTASVQLSIRAESGNTVTLKWAALYAGTYTADTLPPYKAKGYAEEMLDCRRYRLVYPTIGTYAVAFATGIVQTATTARFSIDLPVELRLAAPSISVEGVTWGVYTAGQNITPTEVTVLKAAGNKLYLQATASGMIPGETACLVFKASSDAGRVYIDASA